MALQRITFRPGVITDDTGLASEGGWTDADGVRFSRGRAETIGGWERAAHGSVGGPARGLHAWASLLGDPHVAIGTPTGLWLLQGGALHDITPTGLSSGLTDGLGGLGFGTGGYSQGGYGQSSITEFRPRVWSFANFGEDLIAAVRDGAVYRWDLSAGTGAKAAPLPGAPARVGSVLVSNRIVVALGASEESGGTFNPLLVRWSDTENAEDWQPREDNLAGEQALDHGSRIVRALRGRGENLVWTDTALFRMTFTPDTAQVWDFDLIGQECGLIGQNAAVVANGTAYWMGQGQFFILTGGSPQPIDCPVRRAVFAHLAPGQEDKVFAGVNQQFNEVWWWYPDIRDGNECSRAVVYNYGENHWTLTALGRTGWVDQGPVLAPVAVDAGGTVFFHERGSSADGGPKSARLTSGWFDIGEGNTLISVTGFVPDIADQRGAISLTVHGRPYPNGAEITSGPFTVTPATQKIDLRLTARQIRIDLASEAAPSFWRLGALRLDTQDTRTIR